MTVKSRDVYLDKMFVYDAVSGLTVCILVRFHGIELRGTAVGQGLTGDIDKVVKNR